MPGWTVVADGDTLVLPIPIVPDPETAAGAALAALQRAGHLAARVDSAAWNGTRGVLYVTRGALARVVAIDWRLEASADDLGAWMPPPGRLRPGDVFSAEGLAADLAEVEADLARRGFLRARAELTTFEPKVEGVHLGVTVHPGPRAVFAELVLVGEDAAAVRTRPSFAARAAGLPLGHPAVDLDPEHVRRNLRATGLFEEVGMPEVDVRADGAVRLLVPVREADPVAADVVVGYLPPSGGAPGRIVGSGTLALRNVFGQGLGLDASLQRHPGLVGRVDVRASAPLVAGWPLRLEGRFQGLQQDTTFTRTEAALEVGWRLAPSVELVAAASRVAVEAGLGTGSGIHVADRTGWFAGLGVHLQRVDRLPHPRQGAVVHVLLQEGRVRRAETGGPTAPRGAERQQRLRADTRVYVPAGTRGTVVLGGEVFLLVAERYDEADLFRLGGAASLRGYDEERFRGNTVARALGEYRHVLDGATSGLLFLDVGFVRWPDGDVRLEGQRWAPGYGVGLSTRTPLGLATVTYALNPEEGIASGRVHVTVSVGL